MDPRYVFSAKASITADAKYNHHATVYCKTAVNMLLLGRHGRNHHAVVAGRHAMRMPKRIRGAPDGYEGGIQ
jgi:hypothetical protein